MIEWKSLSAAAVLTAALVLGAGTANAGSCVRAATSATAITKEVATLLAKEGLYQSNSMAGRTGRGTPSVTCKYEGVVTTCRASQVACK